MPLILRHPFSRELFFTHPMGRSSGRPSTAFRHHIEDTENSIQLSIDLPGVKAKDLKVEAKNGVLTIAGSRKIGSDNEASFVQGFAIDERVTDISKMTANLADGVLVLSVPKKDKEETTKIIEVTENPHTMETEDIVFIEKEETQVKPSTMEE